MKPLFLLPLLLFPLMLTAQSEPDSLPYYNIPEAPESYSPTGVVARMVDGLGYRFYWATEGLGEKERTYKPSVEARTLEETVDHMVGLSEMVLNAVSKVDNVRPADRPERTFAEKRNHVLWTLKEASEVLRKADPEALSEFEIVFQNGDSRRSFPFWNVLNGPLADALWHTGQIVSMRRGAGNPVSPKMSVFTGRTRD